MYLKKLSSDIEKALFKENMDLSRTTRKGGGFHETEKSCLGTIHLKYGELWALFDDENKMISGFVIHDLATLPASYFVPDTSAYPPDKVMEGSELWSLTPTAALLLQKGMLLVLQKRDIKCFYAYAPMTPVDLRPFYVGFIPLADPFIWPWVQTDENLYTFCQPLGLKEKALEDYFKKASSKSYTYDEENAILYFEKEEIESSFSYEDNIKQHLREIIQDKLKINMKQISDTHNLADIGIDSLTAIELMAAIEKDYKVQLPIEFFFENNNLEEVAHYLTQNVTSK